jgi:hypothetical protein
METFVVKYALCAEDKANARFPCDIESVKESNEQETALRLMDSCFMRAKKPTAE